MDPHLDPDTLAAYVDGRLAVADRALANRHIDACVACRSELSALAALHEPPEPPDVSERTLGRYRLAGELGETVRAYDPELARSVVLQRLGDVDIDQLRGEARTLAGLRHPGIVAAHDVLETEQGTYLVTELVEGTSLRTYCQGRPRREILEVCIRAGRVLAAAHDAGIVHRDFRPESVLVGADGEVRVSGFALGRRDPANARDDQHGFCLAVHELLTGVLPGTGRAPGSVTLSASLSRRIARVLRRGLARDPAARFPSLHVLLEALDDDARVGRRRLLLIAAVSAGAVVAGALAISAAC
ncbi:MAG TPA: protein kinase [Kofleriaceae bacterium]|nr:protein kinase [Kofleriaceae bacterium]